MNNIFPSYTKPTIFLSGIIGLALGLLLSVPVIQLFAVFLFLFVGSFVVLLLLQHRFIDQATVKDAIIIGSVSGSISVIAAAVSFLPLSLIINAITKTPFLASFFSSVSAFVVLIMLIICLAFMNVIVNILSALVVVKFVNNSTKNTFLNNSSNSNFNIFKK